MGCFKIVTGYFGRFEEKGPEWDLNISDGYYAKIEVHHEGPIVEREVPVWEVLYRADGSICSDTEIIVAEDQLSSRQVIKLPICQSCGLVIFEKEENNGQKK
jgi:hypothetical protein